MRHVHAYTVRAEEWVLQDYVWQLRYPYLTVPCTVSTNIKSCTLRDSVAEVHIRTGDPHGLEADTQVNIHLPDAAVWDDKDFGAQVDARRKPGKISLLPVHYHKWRDTTAELCRAAHKGDLDAVSADREAPPDRTTQTHRARAFGARAGGWGTAKPVQALSVEARGGQIARASRLAPQHRGAYRGALS